MGSPFQQMQMTFKFIPPTNPHFYFVIKFIFFLPSHHNWFHIFFVLPKNVICNKTKGYKYRIIYKALKALSAFIDFKETLDLKAPN